MSPFSRPVLKGENVLTKIQQPRGYAVRRNWNNFQSQGRVQGKRSVPRDRWALGIQEHFHRTHRQNVRDSNPASQRDAQSHIYKQVNEGGEQMLPPPLHMKGATFYPKPRERRHRRGWLEEKRNRVRAEAAWGGFLNGQRRKYQHFSEARAPRLISPQSLCSQQLTSVQG